MDSPLLSHSQHWTFSSCFPVKSDVHVKKYIVLCRIRLGDFPENSVCSAALFCLFLIRDSGGKQYYWLSKVFLAWLR